WIRWLRKNGGGGGIAETLKNIIGDKAWEELDQELASEGVAVSAELDDIDRLRQRAEAAGGGGRIYAVRNLDGEPSGITRIGGAPPGVDGKRWPRVGGEPLTHLFTVDVETMPELRARVGKNVRAISLFCLNPDYNHATKPDTPDTVVLLST